MAIILVIEGEQTLSDQLQSMLSSQEHEVLLAKDGNEGLELFRQRKPRFTLLDFQPPGMDGIAVLEQIRATDPTAAVIMLDGGVPGDLKIQAWRLGALDFMKKDLPSKALINMMGRAMLRLPRAPEVLRESELILIVDDEPPICKMVSDRFTKLGYRVLMAHNGQEALALVKQEAPRLIIIDIYMPLMDGLELARELRARKYEGGILALTGSLDEDKLQGMLDLGAMDVIGKPVPMERLELAVHLGCILAADDGSPSLPAAAPSR